MAKLQNRYILNFPLLLFLPLLRLHDASFRDLWPVNLTWYNGIVKLVGFVLSLGHDIIKHRGRGWRNHLIFLSCKMTSNDLLSPRWDSKNITRCHLCAFLTWIDSLVLVVDNISMEGVFSEMR